MSSSRENSSERSVRRSKPGFRLSSRDVFVLFLTLAVVVWLGQRFVLAASLLLTVVGHFFLFCNVFRVPTRLELLWAAIFLINVVGLSMADMLTTQRYLFVQLPITVFVIGLTVRLPNYHGLAWSRINPGLEWDDDSSA